MTLKEEKKNIENDDGSNRLNSVRVSNSLMSGMLNDNSPQSI